MAGLLVPVGDGYQFVTDAPSEAAAARYRFAHDRVHEAAYALIPEGERPAWHLRLGRLWQRSLALGDRDVSVFAVVNQLNLGRSRITDPDERRALATLNLEVERAPATPPPTPPPPGGSRSAASSWAATGSRATPRPASCSAPAPSATTSWRASTTPRRASRGCSTRPLRAPRSA